MYWDIETCHEMFVCYVAKVISTGRNHFNPYTAGG